MRKLLWKVQQNKATLFTYMLNTYNNILCSILIFWVKQKAWKTIKVNTQKMRKKKHTHTHNVQSNYDTIKKTAMILRRYFILYILQQQKYAYRDHWNGGNEKISKMCTQPHHQATLCVCILCCVSCWYFLFLLSIALNLCHILFEIGSTNYLPSTQQ